MGYELDRMMQQYGFSTPVLSYSGMSMPIKPGDIATGASAMEKANYDALLAKYNADMPLYTSDQAKYKTYSDEYNNRLANTSMYNAPQFQTGAMSSPGTGMFTDQYSQMYQDVLGRAPDATGLAYWKGKFGDMISPEEYAQFRQSAAAEIGGRPINTLPVTTPRAILNQPTYSTPTAAPVLQTAAKTTNPYVLPVDVGGGGGYDGGGLNDGLGGGGGGLGVGPGQGVSSTTQNTALGLMALGDKYPAWAPLGFLAKGLGFIGGKLADSQMDKMAEAQKTLEAIDAQNAAALASGSSRSFDPYGGTKGVMSVTDVNGNVKSFDPYAGDSAKDAGKAGTTATAALSAAESAAADTSGTGGFTSGANADGYGGGDLGAFLAKGGYIGSYAHGGAVRHYQVGGDVNDFEPSQDFKDAEKLTAVLASRKLSPYEREDVESKLEEIYEKIKRRRAQQEPELLTEPVPIPESLLALQPIPAQTRSAMPEPAYIPAMAEPAYIPAMAPTPSGGDLIQPMPESVPVTLRQISEAIAKASPLTALQETVDTRPINAEAAPLVRPLDPRLYGESDEVASGPGYSPMDPRLFGETNEVASGPGYSMPVVTQQPPPVDQKLLNLAAKYTKPGFTPTFAQGSIDPGAERINLISQNAMENKIANPVINIQPEYADDSASRLSGAAPQDTTIPMSPTMAMLQKMLLASQSQASPYADELRTARAAATAQTAAFNKMLENAIKGQDDNKPSKAEMYFRLAAAFGAPTKTGHFAESLAEVNKSMADQAKETRLAGKAGQALKLQLGLEGAKAGMTAAREDVTALRGLTSEEMKEKAAIQRELIKEYFKSGEAQSTAGKQAQDEGLIPGTAKFQARVTAISEEQFKRLTAGVDASLAAAQASLASIEAGRETRQLQERKFEESKKADAAKKLQLSGPEIKMKEETSQALVTMRDAYADLVKALQLSANAYDGSSVDQAIYKPLAATGNQDPKVINTGVLDNLLKLGALSTAATTLKTQISDSDMKMLNQVQGAGAKSRQERDAILKAAMVRMENMYQEKKSKLAEIVAGKYRIATPAIAEEAE